MQKCSIKTCSDNMYAKGNKTVLIILTGTPITVMVFLARYV